MIQFIRYAPLVAERGGRVLVECHPPLKTLLQTVEGVDQVIGLDETLPAFDVHAPLLSLPKLFGTTLDTIPAKVPYMRPRARVVLPPAALATPRLKVGLAWGGNLKPNRHRSLRLSQLEPLLNLEEVVFYTLQVGPAAEELKQSPPRWNVIDMSPVLKDFAATAAVIAELDLVISIDTSVAHLAGALGKPAWALLLYVPDWRWLLDREDSPWYPTMRLFRQPAPRDWDSTIETVAVALTRRAQAGAAANCRAD